jgi:hypothetical protein
VYEGVHDVVEVVGEGVCAFFNKNVDVLEKYGLMFSRVVVTYINFGYFPPHLFCVSILKFFVSWKILVLQFETRSNEFR